MVVAQVECEDCIPHNLSRWQPWALGWTTRLLEIAGATHSPLDMVEESPCSLTQLQFLGKILGDW